MQKPAVDPTLRTLSDADVEAIVEQLQESFSKKFYNDLGKGVWARVKELFILGLIALAAYGSYKGGSGHG